MRENFEKKVRESNPSLALGRYEDPITASEFGREVGDYRAPMARELWEGYKMACEPTHYAVIDEHGEMLQSFKVEMYRDAERLCKQAFSSMDARGLNVEGWTVKGVTVHD